jgi:hypothetical protein
MRRGLLGVAFGAVLLAVTINPVPPDPVSAATVVAPADTGGESPPGLKTVTRSATLASADQPMWGEGVRPSNRTIEWFDFDWDTSAALGGTNRVCVGIDGLWEECGRFGAEINASVDGEMGMALELAGFGADGTIDVTYPVTIDFTAPEDNSFDPGDTVEIATAMTVDADNARITGRFPSLSSIAWTGKFHAGAEADVRLCFIDCDRRDLFDFSGGDGGEIVKLTGDDLAVGCFDTILGILTMIALGMDQYESGRCGNVPYLMNPKMDLSSQLNDDGTVSASGTDLYAVIPVSGVTWAFRGLGAPWWAIPNLNPVGYRGTEVGWTSFNAIITALETMRQDLLFDPSVDISLDWGDDLAFEVVDADTGEVLQSGTGSSATFVAGDTLRLATPAVNSKVITVEPTVSMAAATLSNHTRSQTSGTVELKALSFTLETERKRVCVEGECLTLWPGTKTSEGPLYREAFSLGSQGPATVFNGTFGVGGFEDVALESFDVVPRPIIEVRKALVPDIAPGLFDLLIDDEVFAADVRDGGTTGRVVVEPGNRTISEAEGSDADLRYYDITITCRHYDHNAVHTAAAGQSPGLGASMNVVLTGGEDLICTVQNRLPVPAECDSMVFDNVILGTPGADVADRLIGTTGNDIIVGYGGDDILIGGAGDDCIAGNGGNNIINGGAGNDVIDGGTGDSICTAGVIMRNCAVTGPRE